MVWAAAFLFTHQAEVKEFRYKARIFLKDVRNVWKFVTESVRNLPESLRERQESMELLEKALRPDAKTGSSQK